MKTRSFIAVTLGSVMVTGAQATRVFDTVTGGGPSYSVGLPGSMIGDVLNLPRIHADQYYRIEKIRVALIQRPTLPTNRTVTLNLQAFAGWSGQSSGRELAFTESLHWSNWTVPVVPETETVFIDCPLDLAANGLAFDMRRGSSQLPLQLIGSVTDVEVQNDLTFGLVDRESLVPGTGSPSWFYRDTDSNQLLTGSDARRINGWSTSNLWVQVEATVVPEPASMAVLGLGLAAFRRRRAKK